MAPHISAYTNPTQLKVDVQQYTQSGNRTPGSFTFQILNTQFNMNFHSPRVCCSGDLITWPLPPPTPNFKTISRKQRMLNAACSLEDIKINLAKLGDGLEESPTVMVGDNHQNWEKIGAY